MAMLESEVGGYGWNPQNYRQNPEGETQSQKRVLSPTTGQSSKGGACEPMSPRRLDLVYSLLHSDPGLSLE